LTRDEGCEQDCNRSFSSTRRPILLTFLLPALGHVLLGLWDGEHLSGTHEHLLVTLVDVQFDAGDIHPVLTFEPYDRGRDLRAEAARGEQNPWPVIQDKVSVAVFCSGDVLTKELSESIAYLFRRELVVFVTALVPKCSEILLALSALIVEQ